MDLNEMNENWQEEAPTLAAVEKKNPFTVPEGYFAEMEEQVLSRITISEFDNNNSLFIVPEDYFQTLQERVGALSQLEQLKAPEAFSVPEGYFTNLEERIKSKLSTDQTQESKPKVRRLFSSWSTYAAAASIIIAIGLGVYFGNKNTNSDIEAQIAALPAEEIVDYLQLYSDAGDAPIILESLGDEAPLTELGSEVSEQEIEQYLKLNL